MIMNYVFRLAQAPGAVNEKGANEGRDSLMLCSVRELKERAMEIGVDVSNCCEKDDMVDRIIEARMLGASSSV